MALRPALRQKAILSKNRFCAIFPTERGQTSIKMPRDEAKCHVPGRIGGSWAQLIEHARSSLLTPDPLLNPPALDMLCKSHTERRKSTTYR